MSKAIILWGHALLREGAPAQIRVGGQPTFGSGVRGSGGPGVGVCECGAMSGNLRSGLQRKQWHRDHKAAIVAAVKAAGA